MTLSSCCRNVLCKAKELGLQTIGLCTISSQANFPPPLGAHIALSKEFIDCVIRRTE